MMTRRQYWYLDGHEPVPTDDIMLWGRSTESEAGRVAKTTIGDVYVSTVFLGIDHNFGGGVPILRPDGRRLVRGNDRVGTTPREPRLARS